MKSIFILLFSSMMLLAQSWHSYYNRIPAWPGETNLSAVEKFTNSLTNLKQELQDNMPDYGSNYENMSQAEAMKLAMEFQKNAMNMSPSEIARRSQLAESAAGMELTGEINLDRRLASVKDEFEKRFYNVTDSLRNKYRCDPGLGETGCDILSQELIKASDKLSSEYFIGNKARLRMIIDEANDYMIKKKLPLQIEREKDQMKLMGTNVTGELSGLQMVQACVDQLLYAADKMEWLARLKEDGNVFYHPGQAY